MKRERKEHLEAVTATSAEIVSAYRDAIEDDESDLMLGVIHYRGGQVEFDLGRKYALSADPLDRVVGAQVLSQLGWSDDTFHDESVESLLRLVVDPDEKVVVAACYALGHRRALPGVPLILPLVKHKNPDMRLAAAGGLAGLDDPSAVAGLITLTADEDFDVRNWAAFNIGTMIDVDTPEIRAALLPLLDDPDAEIRGEALIGLAKRHDPRVLQPLIRELERGFHGNWCVEAAELLGDPQLKPLLVKMCDALTVEDALFFPDFERAIAAYSK